MIHPQVKYNAACPKCGVRWHNPIRPVGEFVHIDRCEKHLSYETWSSLRNQMARHKANGPDRRRKLYRQQRKVKLDG